MLNAAGSNSQFIPKLTFKVITDCEELDQFQPEWTQLFVRASGDNLHFQTFAWCRQWCRQYIDQNTRPYVLVGYAIDRPVLIWPLVLNTQMGRRTLSWMGSPLSQYGDVLVEDHSAAVNWIEQGWQFLKGDANADIVELARVRETSAIGRALWEMEQVSDVTQQAPSIDLSQFENIEAYRKALSKKARKHRKRMRRLLSEEAPLSFHIHDGGANAIRAINVALAYKAGWLKAKGVVSRAMSDARTGEFWTGLAEDGPAAGLVISELRCGDVPISIEIALRHGEHHVAHVGAYHPDFEQFSPGTVQMEDTIEHCLESGISVYDLLPPNDAYKARWANQNEVVCDYVIAIGGRGHVLKQLGVVNVNAILKNGFYSLPTSVRKPMASLLQMPFVKK